MKNIKSLCYLLILFPMLLKGINDSEASTTIFTPIPLFELHKKDTYDQDIMSFIKKAFAPLIICFYLSTNDKKIGVNLIENPYIASILLYSVGYYSVNLAMKSEQNKIDQEIINMMQRVFHFLIIGHGIYNEIIAPPYNQDKATTPINTFSLTTLQLFLNKAHETWLTLFSYYKERYKKNPLYAYHMNQVNIFETLQASSHEPDILPLIANFYDKDNRVYDYEPILNCLEIKLKKINNKLIRVLPGEYRNNDLK